MVGEWIRNVFIKKAICNILLLSLIPTKRNLLSTIFDGPPLSPERETFRMLPLINFCILALCKNRTFLFTPELCKDCTILSREWHNHSCGLAALWSALKLNKSQTYNRTLFPYSNIEDSTFHHPLLDGKVIS